MNKYRCVICDEIVEYYEPEYCCSGRECGCMGSPIEPPVCNKVECLDRLFGCIS